ncbi:hypothetical protein [Pyrobaculum aerophilum]|uniref:Uncharacterized protein n=1 Tax=Pyrobaculum aerophilum TaxID=13773 RepID=A0A371R2K2_9CREN|nr:hypothetical protein [Pyrobaculum aerophilum]RFA95242.1 hypothetical protein CGL52_13170 [Pyrobaculum aerophilum]RFA97727.1 hypothetical protein CGL51_02390 [Pyrobaculum aerophilum]
MPTDAPVGCATVLDRALPPFATGTVLAGLGYSAAAGIALAGGWPLAVVLAARLQRISPGGCRNCAPSGGWQKL